MTKVGYFAPYTDGTGYANAAIRTMLSLDAGGVDVKPIETKLAGQIVEPPQRIRDLEKNKFDKYDVVIQHLLPPAFCYYEGAKNIGYFHVETTSFKTSLWQHYANLMDEIWVCCEENAEACRASNVLVPVKVVPIGMDLERYKNKNEPVSIGDSNAFCFYSIADWSSRKNLQTVVKAYFQAFTARDNVKLVLKTYLDMRTAAQSSEQISRDIDNIRQSLRLYRNKDFYPPVYIITEYISDHHVHSLHQMGDCFVTAEKGAAWNIPAFDAMAYGNAVIANDWGGQTQFIHGDPFAILTETSLGRVEGMVNCGYEGLYTSREFWGEPLIEELIQNMIYVKKHFDKSEKEQLQQQRFNGCLRRFGLAEAGRYLANELSK